VAAFIVPTVQYFINYKPIFEGDSVMNRKPVQ